MIDYIQWEQELRNRHNMSCGELTLQKIKGTIQRYYFNSVINYIHIFYKNFITYDSFKKILKFLLCKVIPYIISVITCIYVIKDYYKK